MSSFLVSGASSGIGEACAHHLAGLGHRVYAGVRTAEDERRLRAEGSKGLVPVFLDVTDEAQIDAVAARICSDTGSLEGLVNNAGIAKGGPIEYLPLDDWREQFEANVFGHLAVTKALLSLVRAGRGRIVFIGSIGGKLGTPLMGPYGASKFAVEAIGETLRYELRPWGIGVSVVEPGAVKTRIWAKGRREAERLEHELSPGAADRYAAHIAAIRKGIDRQERLGASPEKVARAVEHALFSARPRTRYPVGADARVQSALVRLLPDRAREAIVRRFLGL